MRKAAPYTQSQPARTEVVAAREPGGFFTDLSRALFKPVDNSSIVLFRIAFGLILLWEVTRYFRNGWINSYYVAPHFFFKYYGFSWVRPWPAREMYLHFYVLGLLAVAICVGFMYRVATVLFFLGFTYVFLLDQTNYLNHFYLISLISFLLIFVPAHRAVSLDAYLEPGIRSDTAPAWALWLLRFQIGVAYFFGGLAKLNPDWLHGQPMRQWLYYRVDFPVVGRYFSAEPTVYLFAYGGLLLDLLIVPALLWRRTRKYAFVAAVAFHLMNAQLFSIGVFPWFMLFATMLFFPPDWPRRVFRALFKGTTTQKRRDATPTMQVSAGPLTRGQKMILATCAAYALLQLVVPLRHLLYPGNVNWTEQGHRFSWHMKLRDKEGYAMFTVKDVASGREWQVDPQDHLTERQAQKMSEIPDMILQFGHYLADYYHAKGYANVEVRVKSTASVNGRKEQPMIDPRVDLAKTPTTLARADWIVPLTQPLPDRSYTFREVFGEPATAGVKRTNASIID